MENVEELKIKIEDLEAVNASLLKRKSLFNVPLPSKKIHLSIASTSKSSSNTLTPSALSSISDSYVSSDDEEKEEEITSSKIKAPRGILRLPIQNSSSDVQKELEDERSFHHEEQSRHAREWQRLHEGMKQRMKKEVNDIKANLEVMINACHQLLESGEERAQAQPLPPKASLPGISGKTRTVQENPQRIINKANTTIKIPDKEVGKLIGRYGCIIKKIQAKTKTSIKIEKGVNNGLQFCFISGNEKDIINAKKIIEEILKFKKTGRGNKEVRRFLERILF